MDIHIDFTYLAISFILWFYAYECILNAFNQIKLSTTPVDMSNKAKATDFIYNISRAFLFVVIYISGWITASNIVLLQYFIVFVVMHHVCRILTLFKNYSDDVKLYSMYEIYINIILYVGTVFVMVMLWAL